MSLTPSNAEAVLVDTPKDQPLFIALSCILRYYDEIPNVSWTGPKKRIKVADEGATEREKIARPGPTRAMAQTNV